MRFKNTHLLLALAAFFCTRAYAGNYEDLTKDFVYGDAGVQSISVMSFGPEGILFLGDSKAGKIIALDMGDRTRNDSKEAFNMNDVEGKLAALMGADIATLPLNVIQQLTQHPLTDIGLAKFLEDAKKIPKA